jgi:mRNA-degrading endonuclease YafQ of YafQ-DinJ toxin-antitoxin module
VNYRFRAAKSFRRALSKLSPDQKRSAKTAFLIFKNNPFDPRLRTHKIHKLSAAYGKTIYAECIEADLRAIFYIDDANVWSVDIGTHAIYQG